jgi:hypothetical protein
MAHEQGPVAVVGIVVVELVEPCRVCPRGLDFEPVTPYPVAKARFAAAFEPKSRRFVIVIDHVDVLLSAVVPEERGAIHLAVECYRYLLIALADGGGLELGDALFKIGAAISAKVGSFDGLVCERAQWPQWRSSARDNADSVP